MGVLGAFVFAAQMVNFAIPGTGSSGHLGGGLLLAMLLGPHAALLVVTSILLVQALFFADGGLLALGCNIFNMGVLPAYVSYPLIYLPLKRRLQGNDTPAIVLAALSALLMGSAAVVAQTTLSGISSLPVAPFALLMLPLHGIIGIAEGLITAAVVSFIRRHRPDVDAVPAPASAGRHLLPLLLLAALITGGAISLLASDKPDGLEWSISHLTEGLEVTTTGSPLHDLLAQTQQRTALFPDYDLPDSPAASRPAPLQRTATSCAGIVGGLFTLAIAALAGFLARQRALKS
jgi:cobalt/nickel transport system permease protein